MIALLWRTHVWNPELAAEFERLLASEGPGMPEVWLLLDAATPNAPAIAARYPRCHLVPEARLRELPYARIHDQGTLGHCHFAVLDFCHAHDRYTHFWVVEYDVRFTGAWPSFFGAFATAEDDLVTAHIRGYAEEPGLLWWPTLGHPTRTIPRDRWWRSFNVIYRVSRRALAYLDGALRDGWYGHTEVILPTLLHAGGFSLRDLGGDGHFVPPGWRNRFYTSYSTPNGWMSPFGTVAFRPARLRSGWRRDTIYHPIKPATMRDPPAERYRLITRYLRDRLRNGPAR